VRGPITYSKGCRADNNKGTSAEGRIKDGQGKGSAHPRAVLTEEIVTRICSLRRFGLSTGMIAGVLGLNRSTVKNLVYNGCIARQGSSTPNQFASLF
jgi:hypothetical protein